ncbi:MAG: ABC transporter permease [Gemmatimonadetes bacterium]|nr:ABC transporter permease [Gemmatimonadota bacterium]
MRVVDRVLMALEGVTIAFDAIRGNKVRAALTISGVAVGVFVVVAMGAAVHGIRQSFQSDMDEFGATSFQLRRTNPVSVCDGSDETCPEQRNPAITVSEWRAIQRLPEVQSAIGWLFGSGDFAYRDRYVKGVNYDAQSTEWAQVDLADVSPGRSFTESEHDGAAPVALVNDSLKSQLFGDTDPIGKSITISGKPFTVIGVFHTKAGFIKALDGRGPDKPRALLPMMSAYRHLDVWKRGFMAFVKPRSDVTQAEAIDAVTALLRSRRGLKPGMPNNFYLVGQDRMLDIFNQLFGAIFLVGLALSGVGLLVGGVGVVAIMMISVTERTREIGVRKALGATSGLILWQFLIEAATLTCLGAAIGLGAGAGLAALVKAFTPIPASVPLSAVVSSLVAAALTGVLFGAAPAARAARLDPIAALRHE